VASTDKRSLCYYAIALSSPIDGATILVAVGVVLGLLLEPVREGRGRGGATGSRFRALDLGRQALVLLQAAGKVGLLG
jgi:hypothetical protein